MQWNVPIASSKLTTFAQPTGHIFAQVGVPTSIPIRLPLSSTKSEGLLPPRSPISCVTKSSLPEKST